MKRNIVSNKILAGTRRSGYVVQAAVLSVSAALPIFAHRGTASAAMLTERKIDMSANSTSEGSGRDGGDAFGQDVTYRVSFKAATAATIKGVVVEFCSNSPLLATACTAPTGFDVNESTVVITALAGITGVWTKDAATEANKLIITNATGNALAAGDTVTFELGTSSASDGVTNPTSAGTFYGRIATYTATTAAAGYTSENPDAVGARTDDGGVALAVASELTVTARVQETLQFCVGTTDANTNSDCTDISGTSINLGVVDSSTVAKSSASAGLAMIRTNAYYGATISYKAEQNTSSGKLKVDGATCNGTVSTDQCFNSVGTTKGAIVAGTEKFGMTLTATDTTNGGITTNLSCDTQYNGDGSCGGGTATGYAWDDTGAFDQIASSSSVVDDEMVKMQFAATAAPTTPTGQYTVTANFVATATF